jgi:hypothetical protein
MTIASSMGVSARLTRNPGELLTERQNDGADKGQSLFACASDCHG